MRTERDCTIGLMPPTVVISARGEERLRRGHVWVYRTDIVDVQADAGDVVVVRGARGRTLGRALFSSQSQIALRSLSASDRPDGEPIEALVRARIERAIAFRSSLRIDATAYRLVHGEGDLMPSLIVDRYGDYLVVQTLSQAMDRLLPVIGEALECLSPKGILARNDPR